jgi:hypothetical protein
MSFRTIVTAFGDRDQATAAIGALTADGFSAEDIRLLEQSDAEDGAQWSGEPASLWHRIVGQEVLPIDASNYRELLAQGGAVVAMRVPEHDLLRAHAILERHHPAHHPPG